MKERLRRHAGDGARDQRAREGEWTAVVAWGAAIAAGLRSRVVKGAHTGDVVLALYLALLGVGLWIHAVRMRHATRAPTFTPTLANVLMVTLAVALLLGIADLASRSHDREKAGARCRRV